MTYEERKWCVHYKLKITEKKLFGDITIQNDTHMQMHISDK